SVLLGRGDGTFQTGVNYPADNDTAQNLIAPNGSALADVNGDGALDLVIAAGYRDGSHNGSANVLLGRGDGTFQPPVTYVSGTSANSIAVGDVNGDGRLDLVTTDFTGSAVDLLLGSGHGVFGAAIRIAAGPKPSVAVVSDVNGDSAPDLIVLNYGLTP